MCSERLEQEVRSEMIYISSTTQQRRVNPEEALSEFSLLVENKMSKKNHMPRRIVEETPKQNGLTPYGPVECMVEWSTCFL